MLRLIRLSVELERMLHEAEARSMRALFDAWDREIEAHQKALITLDEKKKAEAAHQAAIASSVELYLRGLVEQASSGDDVTVSIPTGVRVAGVGGPSIDALHTLADAVGEADELSLDPAQRSAAWALGHGFMPHPSDVASILDQVGVDRAWSERFAELGDQLEAASRLRSPSVGLTGAGMRLQALEEQRSLLEAYGPDRLLRLVADPRSLTPGAPPPERRGGRAVDQAMRMLQ